MQFQKFFGGCLFTMKKSSLWKGLIDIGIVVNAFSPPKIKRTYFFFYWMTTSSEISSRAVEPYEMFSQFCCLASRSARGQRLHFFPSLQVSSSPNSSYPKNCKAVEIISLNIRANPTQTGINCCECP